MTSSTGVTITTAGTGGVLAGNAPPSGLDGLFAALMGPMDAISAPTPLAAPTAPAVGEGMISILLGVKAGDEVAVDPKAALPLGGLTNIFSTQPTVPVTEEVQLGDGPVLTVSGDAESLSAFVQNLKDIYQKVVVEGGLTIGQLSDSSELAGALTKLGLSPEDAVGVAERIQTMLKILEQQQDVDEETAGSLVAMMLAVMGQNAQPPVVAADGTTVEAPNFGLQIVSVEQTPVTTNANSNAATMTAWNLRVSGDVARDLLGLDTKAGVKDEVVEKASGELEKPRKVEVALTTEGDAAIAVGVPEVKAVPVVAVNIPVTDAQPSVAAQAATAVTTTGAAVKVAADERIEAPKGDTYYKLQADKNGVETLEAVKPATEVRDQAMANTQAGHSPTAASAIAAQAAAATDSGFAERVAQIQAMVEKADVGKQVAVQMMPLVEKGGGTVRINLNPKELGQITVELSVLDGKVHGSIAASDPAVVEQLARELHSLRHGLADAGLKLGEQGIALMLNNGNQQNGQQGQGQEQAQASAHGQGAARGDAAGTDGAAGEDLAVNIAAWVSPDRVLDVNV